LLVFDRTLEASLVRECCGSISGLTWGPGPNDVTYVDAESGDPPRVVIVDIQTSDTDSLTVLNEPHFAAEPSWSHDGRWLAIEAQPTRRLRGMTVFTYDTETGALTLIDPTEEPIPKSAAPRFSPTAPILAYTYSAIGAQASEVRLYDMVSRTKTTAEGRGLNDPRWASDGGTILAVRHRSVCETDLVLIDPTSLETDVVLRSGRHLSPMFLSDGVALVVDRACRDADTIPTEPGELLVLDLADGSVEHVAGHVYSARPVAP
jgi:Tol biopolymer transport system component